MSTVLVTGGSGFVGIHVVLQLLADGHDVRTTVRWPERQADVRAMLREGGVDSIDPVSFFPADLTREMGWRRAVDGCQYVIHVASPLPAHVPRDENELIGPARDGTLRVLRAARDAGVKRVVLTSSFAAIGYGHPLRTEPFDETIWSNLDASTQPYVKSKTLAERAAWDFVAGEGTGLELAVINPVAILGPVLGPDFSNSIAIIKALLDGRVPAAPKVHFGLVDVRDVAELHLRAMTASAAKGERFLAVSGEPMSILEIANVLRRNLRASAPRLPRFELPDWGVRLAAYGVPRLRGIVPMLGNVRRSTGAKAERLLGWQPRGSEEAILATAESLIRLGLTKA
jgi:dihydroflavonol-4-reductase